MLNKDICMRCCRDFSATLSVKDAIIRGGDIDKYIDHISDR